MRKLMLLVLIAFFSFTHGQEVKVKWQDNQGRVFRSKHHQVSLVMRFYLKMLPRIT